MFLSIALALIWTFAAISNGEVCEDKAWQCMIWKDQCDSDINKEFMTKKCQKTCGLCKDDCEDESQRCERFEKYCNVKLHQSFMKKICRKTCGFCKDEVISYIHEYSPPEPKPILPTALCGKPDVQSGRVINGVNAKKGAWPWQALITYFDSPLCGGSIISPTWIVTAAHCIAGNEVLTDYFKVVVGGHDFRSESKGIRYDVKKIISHEGYIPSTFNNDIALIELKEPVMFNKLVKPVCLPKKKDVVQVGTKCFITGWGKIDIESSFHPHLQQAMLPVISNDQCSTLNTKTSGINITDNMLCAGHGASSSSSGCHGDSGGPLVCKNEKTGRWFLHGAVSWGSETCDTKKAYTVFARITHLREWIDDHL